MRLIAPLSTSSVGAQYFEALPEPTKELCGVDGIYIAVGYPSHSLVYRGVWNDSPVEKGGQRGSWAFAYHQW